MFSGGFPGFRFGGFGDGDMHSGEEESPNPNVDNKKLYELLEVDQSATIDEIKKAFRKKAIKMHPDKGGDPEKFAEINEAYEVLSNPEKKELYDKYGLDGVKNGGPPNAGFDIFDLLSGGGMRGQQKGPKKVKPTLRELKVKLEDIYKGKMMHLPIERKRVCEKCDGKGGANIKTCSQCKGRGMVEKIMQFGPGMYQHSTQPCGECRGAGKSMDEKDKCKECKGQKVANNKKSLEVAIEQGVPDDHDYIFHGEGDEIPGAMAGDVYVRIKTEKHPVFVRKGADLFLEKTITLLEALTGFNFELDTLDGGKLPVSTMPGEVISHGDIKVIKNKGMPFYKDRMSHGHIIIKFNVQFPKRGQINKTQIEELKKILPGPKTGPSDKKNAAFLEDFDETDTNPNPEGGRRGGRGGEEEEDEDLPRGAQRVQCNQQ